MSGKSNIEKYKELKDSCVSKIDSFNWWLQNAHRPELGVHGIKDKIKKMSLRAGDDTYSTSFYPGLSAIDFGASNKPFDPIDRVMEVTRCSFARALQLVVSWEYNASSTNTNHSFNNTKREEDKKEYPLNKNIVRECMLNKINFQNEYDSLKYGLFRACTDSEIKVAEKLLSIGYSPVSKYDLESRIFIPEFDENGEAWGFYKYNRNSKVAKGLLRSNSKRVLFGSHLLKNYPKDIIYAEGHTDVVVNISKRYAAITTGSATKNFGANISLLANKTLHDFPDLDIPGMIGAINRGREIDEYNEKNPDQKIEHIIYWWSEWFKSDKIYEKIINNKVEQYEAFFYKR